MRLPVIRVFLFMAVITCSRLSAYADGDASVLSFTVKGCAGSTSAVTRTKSALKEVAAQVTERGAVLAYGRAGKHQCCGSIEIQKSVLKNEI